MVTPPYEKRTYLQCPLDLDDLESFNHIAVLDVIVSGNSHTAFLACRHFLDGILAYLQGCKFARIDDNTVTDEAALGLLDHLTVTHDTSCDGTDLADMEGLLDLCSGGHLLLLLRLEHTLFPQISTSFIFPSTFNPHLFSK